MNEAEDFLLRFHERHPGCTRIAFASGENTKTGTSSYELLSSLADNDQVLDLGCGDAHLLSLLAKSGEFAVGLDFSPDELAAGRLRTPESSLVRGKAQSLPFAAQSFSLVLSHFAFHLMSNLDVIVDELARVLEPRGRFATIIGGGPKVDDAFEVFLDLLASGQRAEQKVPPIGEKRGRTDEGLQKLFGHHPAFEDDVSIEDFAVDFGGDFDEVWTRLSTIYDLMYYTARERQKLRAQFCKELGPRDGDRIACTMAIRRVTAKRAW